VTGYPHEVCGLLLGRQVNGDTWVERVTEARNLATDRLADRYALDPDDFLAADTAARRDGLDVVGIWHTHPDHPARPSRTDLEAAWEGYAYLILSVRRDGVADMRAWRLNGTAFVEQPIEEAQG
jgi:proteasome lid subunit RPN8/RPN11